MKNEINLLQEGERLDDLQRNNYKIIQNPSKFCFGMDAVLLSSFTRLQQNDKVLDLGTGTGIIPILLAARTNVSHIDALEIQSESVDMARRSVIYNDLTARITIHEGDIKKASEFFSAGSFDCITTNPPYMNNNHGLQNPDKPKAIARHEILCTLDDILEQSSRLLRPGGHFFMVHRPFRLAEIINKMVLNKLEPKRMRLIYPFIDKEPNMVLIEGVRNGKPMMKIEPPLIVYKKSGEYTQDLLDLYNN